MKKIKQIFLLSTLILTTLFVGCNEDDFAGQSNLEVATGVKVTVTSDFASPVSIIEGDNKYNFTVTLDKPQSVDVVVKINQVGGTASADDYTVDSGITIPAYELSATVELKILKDELQEDIETLTLQIGDITTANAALAPVTVSFNIQNYTEGSLITDLSWSTSIKDVAGDLIKPTAAADLKLLITKLDYNTSAALQTIDASTTAFESYEMLSTYADGTYLVVAEAVSFIDLGAQGDFDLDVTVKFNQSGVYNDKTFTFEKAINSSLMTACGGSGFYKLAQITKTGTTYTLSELGEAVNFTPLAPQFSGNYKVTLDEWKDYAVGAVVPAVYNAADGTTTFRINASTNPAIINAATAYLLVTINADSTVTVVSNEDYNYDGGYISTVTGTGTVGYCGSFINLSLNWPDQGEFGYALELTKM